MDNSPSVTLIGYSDRNEELRTYELDRLILSVLERKRETTHDKEMELGELFASLSIDAAKAMYRRFTLPASDDHVAAQFARLPYEARSRLTLFLADARRRQAHEVVGYR